MSYRISISEAAEKHLRRRIPPAQAERIRQAMDSLAEDPRPPRRSRKLSGSEGLRRLRVGEYRVIYEVDDEAREVRILEAWHRQRGYG